jgi:hypothetical protein
MVKWTWSHSGHHGTTSPPSHSTHKCKISSPRMNLSVFFATSIQILGDSAPGLVPTASLSGGGESSLMPSAECITYSASSQEAPRCWWSRGMACLRSSLGVRVVIDVECDTRGGCIGTGGPTPALLAHRLVTGPHGTHLGWAVLSQVAWLQRLATLWVVQRPP